MLFPMGGGPQTQRSPDEGRRSERARRAILQSAWALFDRVGLRALTIEAIADDAGVGKATIYRWWPNKAAVVMDAMLQEMDATLAFPDTGSAREDLRLQMIAVIELLTQTRAGRAYRALVVESQHDAALAEALGERYIAGRRAAAAVAFERGIQRGELRSDLDPQIVIDALYGALYYCVLVRHVPLEPAYADALLDQFYPALIPSPAH
jgi:AcrR family transcriptional regulator